MYLRKTIAALLFMFLAIGCAGQREAPNYDILRRAEKGAAKISDYDTAASPAGGDYVVGVDVSDTSMAARGTTKKFPLNSLPVSAAVQSALDDKLTAALTASPSSDGSWQGKPQPGAIAGEALSVSNIVYRKNVSSETRYFKYSADTAFSDNATYQPCGIVLTAAAGAGSTFTIGKGHGYFRHDAYTFTDDDIGKTVFASETAGEITLTAPSGDDDVHMSLGSVETPDVIEFDFHGAAQPLIRVVVSE